MNDHLFGKSCDLVYYFCCRALLSICLYVSSPFGLVGGLWDSLYEFLFIAYHFTLNLMCRSLRPADIYESKNTKKKSHIQKLWLRKKFSLPNIDWISKIVHCPIVAWQMRKNSPPSPTRPLGSKQNNCFTNLFLNLTLKFKCKKKKIKTWRKNKNT